MSEARNLRILSPQEQKNVPPFYKLMAVALARNEDPGVLARNRYVDATIAELMEAVPDRLFLLAAWVFWLSKRPRVDELPWPVSQFQIELDGALAGVEQDFQRFKKDPAQFTKWNENAPLSIASRLLQGGAQ